MYVVGAVPYLLFYRGQVEPWNGGTERDVPLKEIKDKSDKSGTAA